MPILQGSKFSPRVGGHAPGDVREAFVDEAIPAFIAWEKGPEPTIELREQTITISQLCGLLWNCRDTLPGSAVEDLLDGCAAELSSATYAAAARWMKREIAFQTQEG